MKRLSNPIHNPPPPHTHTNDLYFQCGGREGSFMGRHVHIYTAIFKMDNQQRSTGFGRCPGEGNGNPLWYSCLENSMDRGAWWTAHHGITNSQTGLSA